MLAPAYHRLEEGVDVCHIEVAAHQEVAAAPVVAPEEGMDVFHSAFPGGGVAQMSEIYFPDHRSLRGGLLWSHAFEPRFGKTVADSVEYLLDGLWPQFAFAPDVFVAGTCLQVDYSDAGSFLSAVVLLLHQEIELVEGIGVASVFLFVIAYRFAEANHRDAAFMFEWFQNLSSLLPCRFTVESLIK